MNYIRTYADFLKKNLKIGKPLSVVFDCSNGTVGIVLQKLFRELRSSKFIILNSNPDGNFPAHGPNPMAEGAMDDLSEAVLKNKADLGVIFDADGDRVFFVDNKGRLILPEAAIFLLARNFKGPVVLTVNVGIVARELLAKNRRKIVDSRVGHYFVKKLIREKEIDFASEISGHYYFKKFFYADSGIFAAIQFMNAVSKLPVSLSSWIDSMPKYFRSGELNFEVKDKKEAIEKAKSYYRNRAKKVSDLDGLTMQGDGWWFNLRPSNTEDLLRLNLEAQHERIYNKMLLELKPLFSGKK